MGCFKIGTQIGSKKESLEKDIIARRVKFQNYYWSKIEKSLCSEMHVMQREKV